MTQQPKISGGKGGGGNRNRRSQPRRDFPLTGKVTHTVLATRPRDKEANVLIRVELKRGKLGAHEVKLTKYAVYSTLWDTDGKNQFFEVIPDVIRTSSADGEINFPLTVNLDDPTIVRCVCLDTKTNKEIIIESDAFMVKAEKKEKPKPKPIKAAKLTITQQPVYREAGYWEFGALVKATDGSVATDGHLRVTGPHGLRMRDIGRSKAGDLILKNVAMPQGSRMFRVYLPDDIDEANVTVTLIESGDHEPLTFTRPEERPAEEEFPPAHKLSDIESMARLTETGVWVIPVYVFAQPEIGALAGNLTRGEVKVTAANRFILWKDGEEKPQLTDAHLSYQAISICETGDDLLIDSEEDYLKLRVTLVGDSETQVIELRRVKLSDVYSYRRAHENRGE